VSFIFPTTFTPYHIIFRRDTLGATHSIGFATRKGVVEQEGIEKLDMGPMLLLIGKTHQ